MKRIIAAVLTVVVMLSVLVTPSFATTKADLLTEAAKSPIYSYVKPAVENAARNVEITDEQAAQILPLVQKAVALFPSDNGPTVYDSVNKRVYTEDQINGVMALIDQACNILGYTYTFSSAAGNKGSEYHIGDIVFRVYDNNGKLIFDYDGDLVADTSAAPAADATAWIAIGAGAVMTVLAGAAFISARKKSIA